MLNHIYAVEAIATKGDSRVKLTWHVAAPMGENLTASAKAAERMARTGWQVVRVLSVSDLGSDIELVSASGGGSTEVIEAWKKSGGVAPKWAEGWTGYYACRGCGKPMSSVARPCPDCGGSARPVEPPPAVDSYHATDGTREPLPLGGSL